MGAVDYTLDGHVLWAILDISLAIIGVLYLICQNLDEKNKKH